MVRSFRFRHCLDVCSVLILVLGGSSVKKAMAWEGFDWNTWKEITDAKPLEISSPQAGLKELLPLLVSEGPDSAPITSIQEWEAKREGILETLRAVFGAPSNLLQVPPYAEILGEEDLGTYSRRHVLIATEPDDWIPAYLLLPKDLPDKPMPTTIVLHQTQAAGKEEPCGIAGDPELAYAVELVDRGYICLAPDVIGFGERIPEGAEPYQGAHDFYRKHPNWSFFGKMIWDFQRMVDYLETLPEVDPYRIGCIGHSHGSYGTIVCSAFEPRVSAAIASCGFNTLRTDPTPNRWSHLTALMPRLGFYVERIESAPFDWHEIVACLAPRPYLNWATLDDACFPNTQNLRDIYGQLREVYGLYGAVNSFSGNLVPGKHSFPKEGRQIAYDWLDKKLAPRPAREGLRSDFPMTLSEWTKAREEIRSLIVRDIGPVEPPAGLEASIDEISVQSGDGYLEKKIRYHTTENETVTAYLLVPEGGKEKKPGVVVFHQTVDAGKEEPVGHEGRPSLHFGPDLARRGYVILAPDSICAGERIGPASAFDTRPHYVSYPSLSALAKMIQDGRRAIDVLQSLPEVDTDRIGTIGHSLGAEESLFVAAFDDRVKAAAASCGYAPLAVEKNPSRWARDQWFSYIPRWRIDLRAGRLPAWDFDLVVRLVAPRGYFNYQTRGDEIFPEGAAAHPMVESGRPAWRLYDAEENLRTRLDPGPHDITPEGKADVYEWLDSMLKGDKPG